MRKMFLALLVLFLATGVCFAANATVTYTEWGMEVTGGTSATLIYNGTISAKGIAFSAAAANDTAVLTASGASNVSCMQFNSTTVGNSAGNNMIFIGGGIPLKNLTVTMSNTSDILYVYIK
jgi:hypothetical protein